MEIDSNFIKRLAFIKYLYKLGISLSNKPEPLSSTSILIFHDAIELFLQLSSEFYDIGRSGIGFMDYWEILSPSIPSGTLPQKESMRRFNKSGVALKHHGTFPSKMDIESFRVNANNFFEEATPIIFSIEFEEISLVDFIEAQEAKIHMHEATVSISNDDFTKAVELCAISFNIIIDDFEERKREGFGRSPFNFGDSLSSVDSDFVENFSDCFESFDEQFTAREIQHNLKEFIDNVKLSIESLRDAVRILALGIDYPRYSYFKSVTPYISRKLSGEYTIISEQKNASSDEANFCINFVIETALNLQKFDYTIHW